MVLQTAHIFSYQMIPNTSNNIFVCMPLMGPINNVSSVKKLKFLLGKH